MELIIYSEFFIERLNVALTFNVKPESETFNQSLSTYQKTLQWNASLLNKNELLNQSNENPNKIINDTFAEWDTWETISAVKEALEIYHNVTLIEADLNAFEKFKELKPTIVFNIAEGFNGVSREAQIPAILDMLNIPYSGSDALTLSICLDKARTKEILSYHNIPTAKFKVINDINDLNEFDSTKQNKNSRKNFFGTSLKYPLIVKPNSEGSSKGIFTSSIVKNKKELKREVERILFEYNQSALVEEFLSGREFTVAILGNGLEAEVLPIIEINYKEFPEDFTPIYSYEAKWILDTPENPLDIFQCPANINSKLEEQIKKISLSTYNILRCKDWSRIDIRLDLNGIPNIIEVNPLPGILPNPEENSCFPKAARTAGISYNEMINRVLYFAAKRNNLI